MTFDERLDRIKERCTKIQELCKPLYDEVTALKLEAFRLVNAEDEASLDTWSEANVDFILQTASEIQANIANSSLKLGYIDRASDEVLDMIND